VRRSSSLKRIGTSQKKEVDEKLEKERQAALLVKQRDDQLAQLSNEIASADTIQQLEIRAADLRERLKSVATSDRDFLHRQLVLVQNR
jgi:hypothetical protein